MAETLTRARRAGAGRGKGRLVVDVDSFAEDPIARVRRAGAAGETLLRAGFDAYSKHDRFGFPFPQSESLPVGSRLCARRAGAATADNRGLHRLQRAAAGGDERLLPRPLRLERHPYRSHVVSQFVIDKDGTIYQQIPLRYEGRHTVGLNYVALGIECVQECNGGDARVVSEIVNRKPQERSLSALVRWLM